MKQLTVARGLRLVAIPVLVAASCAPRPANLLERGDGRCSRAPTGAPSRTVLAVTGPGSINFSFSTPPGFDATITNIRDWPAGAMNGSTFSSRVEVADTTDATPLPCVFTAVFEDSACPLEATGKRFATRTATAPAGGNSVDETKWQLVVEAVDPGGCTKARSLSGSAVVDGTWSDLRLARFEQGPNYSGGTGSHGALVDHEGRDLRAEIASWPKDEQALYLAGPGFSVKHTEARDLFWFIHSDESGLWTHRLRDGDGNLLLDHELYEGKRIPLLRSGAILRDGSHLLYSGVSGLQRIR